MNKLKKIRQINNKSSHDVASYLNIPYNTYRNYEKDNFLPKVEILIKLADYYNVTIDELLDRVPEKELYNEKYALKQEINKLASSLSTNNLKTLRFYILGLLENNNDKN